MKIHSESASAADLVEVMRNALGLTAETNRDSAASASHVMSLKAQMLRADVEHAASGESQFQSVLRSCSNLDSLIALACFAANMAADCFDPEASAEQLASGLSYTSVAEQFGQRIGDGITYSNPNPMPVQHMLDCCDAHPDRSDIRRAVVVCIGFMGCAKDVNTRLIKLASNYIIANLEQPLSCFVLNRAGLWLEEEAASTRLRFRPLANAALKILQTQMQSQNATRVVTQFMLCYVHRMSGVLPPGGTIAAMLAALQQHARFDILRRSIIIFLQTLAMDACAEEAAAAEWAEPVAAVLRYKLDEEMEEHAFNIVLCITNVRGKLGETAKQAALAAGIMELSVSACERRGTRAESAAYVLAALGCADPHRLRRCNGLDLVHNILFTLCKGDMDFSICMTNFIFLDRIAASDAPKLIKAVNDNMVLLGINISARAAAELVRMGLANELDEGALKQLAGERVGRRLEGCCPEAEQFMNQLRRRCGKCGEVPHLAPGESRKRCKRCRRVVYCNSECQLSAWGTHKLHCKPASGGRT